MTSAAKERDLAKWQIWGVKKFLEINSPLVCEDGRVAVLESVLPVFGPEYKKLLEEAEGSSQEIDTRIAIWGVICFHNANSLFIVKGDQKVAITDFDIFKAFDKSERQGQRCQKEACDIILNSERIRRMNLIGDVEFCRRFVPSHLLAYTPARKSPDTKTNADISPREFRLHLLDSCELWNTKPETGQALCQLVKHTSQNDYRNSSLGWDEEHKLEEMKDEDMRYIIIRLAGNSIPDITEQWNTTDKAARPIIGFLSFMITQEEEQDVLYIYEVHISEHFRKHGLGQHLFNIVEHIGTATEMEKIMLTVFTCNKHARQWYCSRGFDVDESSPRARKLRGGRTIQPEYEILSKRLGEATTKKVKA